MSSEATSPDAEHQVDSTPPMNEHLSSIEAQKERMRSAHVLRDKINELLSLTSVADQMDKYAREASRNTENMDLQETFSKIAKSMGEDVMTATHDLEKYMLQCRLYDQDFTFKVGNLPRDSFVVEINSYRLVKDEVSDDYEVSEFVADDLDVRGRQGINLINHKQGTRVMLSATRHISVAAVISDETEEE